MPAFLHFIWVKGVLLMPMPMDFSDPVFEFHSEFSRASSPRGGLGDEVN